MSTASFDLSRAKLIGPDYFKRYEVTDAGRPLTGVSLPAHIELLIAERAGQRQAFVAHELARPHVAQGRLAGEPYLVSF